MQLSLFAYGFRPFFLAVGVAAVALLPPWAANVCCGRSFGPAWPAPLWHAHEMLFGFVCAAIAGFMLTAVPSWTGRRGFAGGPLVALTVLWLLGRSFVATADAWPAVVVTVADMAFVLVLIALLAWPLIRGRNRNTPFLAVLLALGACNVAFHVGLSRGDPGLARQALLAGIDVVALLVTVVGGRVTPSFTATALRQRGVAPRVRVGPRMTAFTVACMIVVLAVDLVRPGGVIAGWVALAAAVAQGGRLASWQGHRTWRDPVVWVLHVAYLWLPVGLLLKAAFLLTGLPLGAFWLHALTVGAIATMILGVMTRASLAHTGRPLRLRIPTVGAYGLLTCAALVRVFGPSLPGASYAVVIAASAAAWTAAFALFLTVYTPVLLASRVDGKPG